jgi:dihydroorotate dehydrogenase
MNLSTSICGIELKNPLMPAAGPLVGDERKILALQDFGLGPLIKNGSKGLCIHS